MVIVNGDLLDHLLDEAFVEFGDFGLLTSDEVLQLVEPCLDTVRAHRVGIYYRFCDVLLHPPEETVATGKNRIQVRVQDARGGRCVRIHEVGAASSGRLSESGTSVGLPCGFSMKPDRSSLNRFFRGASAWR